MKDNMKRSATRRDSIGRWVPPADASYVTVKTAAKAMPEADTRGGTEAARQRMLAKMGIVSEELDAKQARQRMIERKQQ